MPAELKIVFYLCFLTGIFLNKSLLVHGVISVIIIILLITVTAGFSRKGWIPVIMILVFTFFGNLLFRHGRVLFSVGPFIMTDEGLADAWVKTARIFCMIAGARLLTAFTSIDELIRAFGRLLRPLHHIGIPVNDYLSTMGLTMKSLPAVTGRFAGMLSEKMQEEAKGGFWISVRIVSSLIVPFFVKCLQSPEEFFVKTNKINDR